MQAVILAAGMGTRLGAAAGGLPKCLLRFGRACLIERTLESVHAMGIPRVLVVVGHQADEVRRVVGGAAETAVNRRFADTNNLASFLLAEPWAREDLLVLNADVLFDPRILERLIAAGRDHVVFDSKSARREEAMKVRIQKGRVTAFSKDLPVQESAGESAGIVLLARDTARAAFALGQAVCCAGRPRAYLGEALATLGLRGVEVADLPWIEIDAPADLERARTEIWPRIACD